MTAARLLLAASLIITHAACQMPGELSPGGKPIPFGASIEKVSINFDSTPNGMRVSVDGEFAGETPVSYPITHIYPIASNRPVNSFDVTLEYPDQYSETYSVDLGKAWDDWYRRKIPVQEIEQGVLFEYPAYRIHFDIDEITGQNDIGAPLSTEAKPDPDDHSG